jgi:hypothetical protein
MPSGVGLDFLEKRELIMKEWARLKDLICKYKAQMPEIEAVWDQTVGSIKFNDIEASEPVHVYCVAMAELWSGIYKPDVYDAETLWSDNHDSRKIVKVIESWENKIPLSPIYLVRHGTKSLALVADGKHRLTVARSIHADDMCFMVLARESGWVVEAFPNAKCFMTIDVVS